MFILSVKIPRWRPRSSRDLTLSCNLIVRVRRFLPSRVRVTVSTIPAIVAAASSVSSSEALYAKPSSPLEAISRISEKLISTLSSCANGLQAGSRTQAKKEG